MEALKGVFAFLWSLNWGQKQTLSKPGVKMEQAVWPRAAVIWARCRNDTGLVEQYHLLPIRAGSHPRLRANAQVLCFSLHQKTDSLSFFHEVGRWSRCGGTNWTMAFNYRPRQRSLVSLRTHFSVSTSTGKTKRGSCIHSCVMVHATWTKCTLVVWILVWYDRL